VAFEKAKIEADVPVELRARKEWHEKQQAMVKADAAHDKARLTLEAHDRTATADLSVLRIALDKARREVAQSEESFRGLQLRAPRPGVVLLGRSPQEDRPVQLGDNLWPGLRAASVPDQSRPASVAAAPGLSSHRCHRSHPPAGAPAALAPSVAPREIADALNAAGLEVVACRAGGNGVEARGRRPAGPQDPRGPSPGAPA
jgi:hypothetical protein